RRFGSSAGPRSRRAHLGRQQFHAAAPSFDLLAGRRADGVHFDGEGMGHLAVAQDLHSLPIGVLDEPRLDEALGVHHRVGAERGQRLEIDDRIRMLATVRQEAALGDPAVERHLAALEATRLAATRAGVVALAALRCRLAVTRARPAADALSSRLRARRRAQVLKLHGWPAARVALWPTS